MKTTADYSCNVYIYLARENGKKQAAFRAYMAWLAACMIYEGRL